MGSYFINKSSDFVLESIEGLVASVPYLQRLDSFPEVLADVFYPFRYLDGVCHLRPT